MINHMRWLWLFTGGRLCWSRGGC